VRPVSSLCSACVAALLAPAAHAYRPFDSTDAAVADRGEIEIELGPVGFQRVAGQNYLIAPALILNWGFADRWELVLEGKQFFAVDETSTGPKYRLDDVAASAKTVLRAGGLQEKSGPSVASELSILLPSINGEPGTGASAALIVSERWPALAVHLNATALWTRSHEPGFAGGVILEGPATWTVRPVGEAIVSAERGASAEASVLAGAIWRLGPQLALDAALRVADETAGRIKEIRLGLTWAFALGGPR
jgi:hypothetical protein